MTEQEIVDGLTRTQEAVLLVAYRYFYRVVAIDEIKRIVERDGLLDMSHNEFNVYRQRAVAERKAMLHFFDRPGDWMGEQLSLEDL